MGNAQLHPTNVKKTKPQINAVPSITGTDPWPSITKSTTVSPPSISIAPPLTPTISTTLTNSTSQVLNSKPVPIDNRISDRIIKTAAKFWHQHIDTLTEGDKLEIGCSIFFGMLKSSGDFKKIMQKHKNHTKIETMSLKYLDMMSWLITYLSQNNQNKLNLSAVNNNTSHPALIKLGKLHKSFGIKIKHFEPMLQSLNETFAYYFPQIYTIHVKYSVGVIFIMTTQIMMQENLNTVSFLNDISKSFCNKPGSNLGFLRSLEICLKSSIGSEYFYGYLRQSFCDEIAIYLQLINKFRLQTCDKERFMIARNIVKTSINSDGIFAVNISFECRQSTLKKMKEFELKFEQQIALTEISKIFDGVEMEMRRLIIKNHWKKFVETVHKW